MTAPPAGPAPSKDVEPVLYVDLDGTLVATDLMWETLFAVARRRPWTLWRLPAWLLAGRASFKRRLAESGPLDPSTLPYRPEVLELLRTRRANGTELVLATASDQLMADSVARHLALFSAVLASDGTTNLKGAAKLAAMRRHAAGRPFGYLGDSAADRPIWEAADHAYVTGHKGRLAALIRALRLHHWVKNVLVFLPPLMAHRFHELSVWGLSVAAFLSFSLAASAGYVLNDLWDLESDRRHPSKRARPLAAGEVSIPVALSLVPVLLGLGAYIAATWLPLTFAGLVALYLALALAYSTRLKRTLALDVVVLAGLYTLRILAGAAATATEVSPWLLAFSMFFFLSLAMLKRYTELQQIEQRGAGAGAAGRGYQAGDIEAIANMGSASGYLAVLVLALYLNSNTVTALYDHPAVLWLLCPLLLYWLIRIWLLAHRGQVDDDPVVFAIRDRLSYLVGGLVVVVTLLARP